MDKNPQVYINHILESINLLNSYFVDVDKKEFISSLMLQDLACRRLEIIGEAVKYLPDYFRLKYPDIKWKSIAGLRDILIHQYFGIDLDLLWNMINLEIPKLKNDLEYIVEKEFRN